jgi:hypothetical protein
MCIAGFMPGSSSSVTNFKMTWACVGRSANRYEPHTDLESVQRQHKMITNNYLWLGGLTIIVITAFFTSALLSGKSGGINPGLIFRNVF